MEIKLFRYELQSQPIPNQAVPYPASHATAGTGCDLPHRILQWVRRCGPECRGASDLNPTEAGPD